VEIIRDALIIRLRICVMLKGKDALTRQSFDLVLSVGFPIEDIISLANSQRAPLHSKCQQQLRESG
jgi:hypothetical protein